jgi:hypothetical protein
LATNTSFLSDEQYNELIEIQSTRIGQGFLKRICKSKCQNKKCTCLKNKMLCTLKCHFFTKLYKAGGKVEIPKIAEGEGKEEIPISI